MKTIIVILIIGGGVYYAAQRGWIQPQSLGMSFGGSAEDRAIADAVEATNKRAPRMMNAEVSFEKVMTDRKDVVFVYRFVNQDVVIIHRDMSLEKMRDAIIQDACGSSSVHKQIFERGYGMRVQVDSRDSRRVLDATVRPSTCPR